MRRWSGSRCSAIWWIATVGIDRALKGDDENMNQRAGILATCCIPWDTEHVFMEAMFLAFERICGFLQRLNLLGPILSRR